MMIIHVIQNTSPEMIIGSLTWPGYPGGIRCIVNCVRGPTPRSHLEGEHLEVQVQVFRGRKLLHTHIHVNHVGTHVDGGFTGTAAVCVLGWCGLGAQQLCVCVLG